MDRSTCPHCGERTFSLWRRFGIGPARTVRCSSCGGRVGVSPVAWLAVVLIGFAGFALASAPNPGDRLTVGVGCVGLAVYLYAQVVSLVPKDR